MFGQKSSKMLLIVLILLSLSMVTADQLRTLIVGGLRTNPSEFPFMVALGWSIAGTGQYDYKCGGALIAPQFVLTAAHCTVVGGLAPVVVLPGGVGLRDAGTQPSPIAQVFPYPEYNGVTSYHDIALLRLNGPVNNVRPIQLAPNFQLQGQTVVAIGYGNTVFAGKPSDQLLKAPLTIVSNRVCQQYYTGFEGVPFGIHNTQLCAIDKQFGRDTCQGDSGGPIVFYSQGPGGVVPLIVGVTSFGQGCATDAPGVYTRVARYANWIASIAFSRGF